MSTAIASACYFLSAVVVLIGLHKLHYNKHLTWAEAFMLHHGEQAWMVVAFLALAPALNTMLALQFILFWPVFDRTSDE